MKGYVINIGYMGWVPALGRYLLFATERDYIEYLEEDE